MSIIFSPLALILICGRTPAVTYDVCHHLQATISDLLESNNTLGKLVVRTSEQK